MRRYAITITVLALALLAGIARPGLHAVAQIMTATPTGTTGAPVSSSNRPVVVIESYYLDKDTIRVGDSFTLFIALKNQGQLPASNLILSMINDSFLPQDNGGVVALGNLNPGQDQTITHAFLVSNSLAGNPVGTIPVRLTYTGPDGVTYSESFAITLQLIVYFGPGRTSTPTPTPTTAPVVRPQMVVSSYKTAVDPLQPGSIFDLEISVRNLGNADGRAVTMVLGGGAQADPSGTPSPGGSGGSSDLSNFAPIGSSNLFFLGDVGAGTEAKVNSRLIVNTTTNPGAYSLKLSFVYTDPKGGRLVDDQIITLLVYQLPQVEASFYRDPGLIYAGQPAVLPIQIVNLGRKAAVLGNVKVTSTNGEVTNNVSLVGPLDPGGSSSLDANFIPQQAGKTGLQVVITYTDDFNQVRQINATIEVTVLESAAPPQELTPGVPGKDGLVPPPPAPTNETLMDKVLRLVKGLFGLDSGLPVTNSGGGVQEGVPSITIDNKNSNGGSTVPLKQP